MKTPRASITKAFDIASQYGGNTNLSGVKAFVESTLCQVGDRSGYFFKNAFGNKVFVNTRSLAKAQKAVDEYYGKGFYRVSASS